MNWFSENDIKFWYHPFKTRNKLHDCSSSLFNLAEFIKPRLNKGHIIKNTSFFSKFDGNQNLLEKFWLDFPWIGLRSVQCYHYWHKLKIFQFSMSLLMQ